MLSNVVHLKEILLSNNIQNDLMIIMCCLLLIYFFWLYKWHFYGLIMTQLIIKFCFILLTIKLKKINKFELKKSIYFDRHLNQITSYFYIWIKWPFALKISFFAQKKDFSLKQNCKHYCLKPTYHPTITSHFLKSNDTSGLSTS